MSVLTDVLREVRAGSTVQRAAAHLGLDVGVVEAAVDHWERLGVVQGVAGALGTCSTCAPTVACAGCPLAGAGRATAAGSHAGPAAGGASSAGPSTVGVPEAGRRWLLRLAAR